LNALLYGSRKSSEEQEEQQHGFRRNSRPVKPTRWTSKLPRGLKATTSARPGETREISFYQRSAKVDSSKLSILLVDLPGYGFAFASEQKELEWQSLMKRYILERGKSLKRILLLVDARHGMKKADVDFLEAMQESAPGNDSDGGDDSSRPLASRVSFFCFLGASRFLVLESILTYLSGDSDNDP
jgi:GTP-binding protein